MIHQPMKGREVIAATFIVALILSVFPLPIWAQWGRPEWVVIVLIYWVLALPERIGIGIAWLLGIVLDILEGTPLGQNAFALAAIACLVLVLYQRVRMFSLWQQASVVFVLIGLYQLLGHWVQTVQGAGSSNLLFLLPAFVSALLWPAVSLLLRVLRRYYYVS
jgi:rod shape-determining protein MreD